MSNALFDDEDECKYNNGQACVSLLAHSVKSSIKSTTSFRGIENSHLFFLQSLNEKALKFSMWGSIIFVLNVLCIHIHYKN